MATVVMIVFEFPPLTGIGVVRSLKLVKYLPDSGVRPVVVTTDVASSTQWMKRPADAGPLDELPADVVIHRVPCPQPVLPAGSIARRLRRMFSLGDEDIGAHWRPRLWAAWDRIIADARPDVVYVSLPPFSLGTVAVELAQRSGVPLIVDFRDAWSQWRHRPRLSWVHYRLLLRQERRVLQHAAAVVTTTRQMALEMQAVHPAVDTRKFHVVPNGYDADLPVVSMPAASPGLFVIGYVGSFYYLPPDGPAGRWWRRLAQRLEYSPRREDWLYRTPYFFFRALCVLFDRCPDLRSRVRVRFAGEVETWLRAQVAEFGLDDVVDYVGRLPHAASLAFQASCDALLATSAKTIGGRDQFIAGKTFEYVAAGRPIIGFVAAGEQRDFLRHSGVAAICDPDDPTAAAAILEHVITGRFAPAQDREFLQRFHRRDIARQMAGVMATIWTSNTHDSH